MFHGAGNMQSKKDNDDPGAFAMEKLDQPAINPPADGIALDGLERGWSHIERATRDGSDRDPGEDDEPGKAKRKGKAKNE